jgi:hypothetical protein
MNWKKLLVSPPPTTCWMVDGTAIAVFRREAKGGVLWAAESTPDQALEVGPVGLQSVEPVKLAPVLSSLQARIEGGKRAAVVVPSGWTRTYLLEFDELPRSQAEIEQVVRWRLKKLLPVQASDLRISLVPVQSENGSKPLLCMVGVDRALAALESAFSEVGVEPGMITTRAFALTQFSTSGARLLVQHEEAFLSLVLSKDDRPLLVRSKPLARSTSSGESIRRELNLALGYIRETLGVTGPIGVHGTAESPEILGEIEDWRSGQENLTAAAGVPMPTFNQGGAGDRLGAARVEPAISLIAEVDE